MFSLSIKTILEYYAMLCLICMPVMFVVMIILARKTNLLDNVDNLVDRLVPDKDNRKTEKTSAEKTDGNDEQKTPSEEEVNEMSGITALSLLVGESYICHLNYQNRGGSTSTMNWSNDNEFVGKIEENGLFTADKVGKTNIFCTAEGQPYDTGAQAYAISVLSRMDEWFCDMLIDLITKRAVRPAVITKFLKRKITGEIPVKRIITYAGKPTEKSRSLTIQFDNAGRIERGCYIIHSNADDRKRIAELLEERYEKVKLKDGLDERITVWLHQIIDNQHEEVDTYAFCCNLSSRETAIGFGRSWRQYGEKQEFLDNIGMALRLFGDILKSENLVLEAKQDRETLPIPIPIQKLSTEKDVKKEQKPADNKEEPKPQEDSPAQEEEKKTDTEENEGNEEENLPTSDALDAIEDYNPDEDVDMINE